MIVEQLDDTEECYVGIGEYRNVALMPRERLIALSAESCADTLAVQLMDSTYVAGVVHLLSSAQNALSAVRGGYSRSRSLGLEILVYASAQKQISRAIEIMGLHDSSEYIAAVIVARRPERVRECLQVLSELIGPVRDPPFPPEPSRTARICALFGVDDTEIMSIAQSDDSQEIQSVLARCVANRVSLVAIPD
ncbi:MAG: KEOPS complex subunit Cgi121 [Candidatus Thorarchaeota archaeon]